MDAFPQFGISCSQPYCQVDQVLITCRVDSWYKKVVIVVEVVNLCVLDYVVPVLPLAPRLEVEDKLEYQSLNQSLEKPSKIGKIWDFVQIPCFC